MITTQKISTATDLPKVAKVTVRTSNINEIDASAGPICENYPQAGVYLEVGEGSTISNANQFVIYFHQPGGNRKRYPALYLNGNRRENNQLVNGTPCTDDPNTYYFPLNGNIPSTMNGASINWIAFRTESMEAGEGWSDLPDSEGIPLAYDPPA